ncbi:MAG: DUF4260 domain-containing protein [Chloroflexota bacterium]|nr:DUF4260 domain-containing protein [Chloroflexota bacterium]
MTRSLPAVLLRVEFLVALAVVIGLYAWLDGSWLLFALLFLAPDLAAVGYLRGPRAGAVVYDLAHTTSVPLALLGAGLLADRATVVSVALIWLAHIAFDRLVGYGLKYPTSFKETHLARI